MLEDQRTPLPGSARWGPASEVWDSGDWRWEATRWIDAVLERRGVTRVPTTPRQPRIRPWSTQLVVEVDSGGIRGRSPRRLWFKAAVPETSREGEVLDQLRRVAPDLVPNVWASDSERHWLLQPDQGALLRSVATADTVVPAWSTVLRSYARLQRAAVGIADDLVAAGVPRLTPHGLVDSWVARDRPEERAADDALLAAAERLAAVDLPLTIQHDDLHAGNVFCANDGGAALQEARIFDWGDCYVGNPLCSLLIALRSPSYHFGLSVDPARDDRLARAYFSGWSDLVPRSILQSILPDALLLARIGRIVGWDRALARASDAERAEWQSHPDRWAAEVVQIATDG